MKPKKLSLAVCGACAVTGAPAAGRLAARRPARWRPPARPARDRRRAAARRGAPRARDGVLRLARTQGAPDGHRLRPGYAHLVATWSLPRLRARAPRPPPRGATPARRARPRARGDGAGGGSVASAGLQSIAACESGGNPRAVGGGGTFRGKYQFDYGTWARVGGSGDPAAAPEAEQDRRAAAMLYARAGSSPVARLRPVD